MYCPNCQLPLDSYVKTYNVSIDKHVQICIFKNLQNLPDCLNYLNCNELKEKHFWLFNHSSLALMRSRLESTSYTEFENNSFENPVNTNYTNINESPVPVQKNYTEVVEKFEESQCSSIKEPKRKLTDKTLLYPVQNKTVKVDEVQEKKDKSTVGEKSSKTNCKSVAFNKKVGQTSILNFFGSTNKTSNTFTLQKTPDKKMIKKDLPGSSKNAFLLLKDTSKNKTSIDTIILSEEKSKIKNASFQSNKKIRKCPFYKYVIDTPFVVDAFNYGELENIDAYFLSHFHYDHYGGLTKKWTRPIYCGQITANLLLNKIKVDKKYINILPLNESVWVYGVEVILLDANHCPGSVMFLFKPRSGKVILHVGDFRASPVHESLSSLKHCSIDVLYLDTTYCEPTYTFPSQESVLKNCTDIIEKHVLNHPKLLVIVGSYTVGKEKVFMAAASYLKCKIWADTTKRKVLSCLEDDEINSRLTDNHLEAQVHVVAMNKLNPQGLLSHMKTSSSKFTHAVALKPTGWTHSTNSLECKKIGNIYLYGVPYSEHSSYLELKRFVQFTQPEKIIPTVNVANATYRKRMESDFKEWLKL